MRAGGLREHKLCRQCWNAATPKRDTKEPKTEADKKVDEAATLWVSGNLHMSRQDTGPIKVRKKVKKRR